MQNTRLIITTVTATSLFVGGIILLLSGVTFWSLYFGIPATQIGIVLIILTFEKASRKTLDEKVEEEMLRQDTATVSLPKHTHTRTTKTPSASLTP